MICIALRTCLSLLTEAQPELEVRSLAAVLSSFLLKILGSWLVLVDVLTCYRRPSWNQYCELFVINCLFAKINIQSMQDYLWIWDALPEHFWHLKRGQHYRNDERLLSDVFLNKLFGCPRWSHKVVRAEGSPTPPPSYCPSVQQLLVRMLTWTVAEWCHPPKRCTKPPPTAHFPTKSPFLREEALTLEHKAHPLPAFEFVWNSPDLWVLRVVLF